jgi:hypothetical protein
MRFVLEKKKCVHMCVVIISMCGDYLFVSVILNTSQRNETNCENWCFMV